MTKVATLQQSARLAVQLQRALALWFLPANLSFPSPLAHVLRSLHWMTAVSREPKE